MDMGFVFYPDAPDEDNALALRVMLEALIALDRIFLARYPQTPSLYKSGVTYARTKVWDSTPDLYARQFGDCKSLSATRVAELRSAGKDARPEFRFMLNPQTGQKDFHILIRVNGTPEDPSRRLGMVEYHQRRNLWVFPE